MTEVRKLKRLFERLQISEHGIGKSVSGGGPLISDFKSNAEDFLKSLELSNYSSALTDAKRAVACQIDEVLECLGFPWKRRPITQKLDVVRKCGFGVPRILKCVNAARNLLEHEYVYPSGPKTEEAVDIASLFVHATRRHLESFMGEFYVGNGSERVDIFHFGRELTFSFDDEKKKFRSWGATGVSPEGEPRTGVTVGRVFISASSVVFPTLIKLTVAGDRESKIRIAFHELFDLFRTNTESK